MSQTENLEVDVVAPDRVLWSGTASAVSVPASEGEMGLLPGHESVLALLRPGTVRVRSGGAEQRFQITAGWVSFDANAVTVVVDGNVGDGD